jgi:large subunit ribosomal protein L21
MYAVIEAGGVQHRVSEGDEITVNHMGLDQGSRVEFDVLMLGGDKSVQFGTPVVSGAKVVAEVLSVPNTTDEEGNRVWGYRGKKVDIYRYNRRHRTRTGNGFRQSLTKLEIKSIEA